MRSRVYAALSVTFTALLLVGLYYGLRDLPSASISSSASSNTFKLVIAAPQPGEALPIFSVTQGDPVTILIASDRAGEADVHGYERKIDLTAGAEVTLSFKAMEAGLFPLHLHEPSDVDNSVHHRHVASLEVRSK